MTAQMSSTPLALDIVHPAGCPSEDVLCHQHPAEDSDHTTERPKGARGHKANTAAQAWALVTELAPRPEGHMVSRRG